MCSCPIHIIDFWYNLRNIKDGLDTNVRKGRGCCAMAIPSDPKNKKNVKQYCLKLASRMHKNAYF